MKTTIIKAYCVGIEKGKRKKSTKFIETKLTELPASCGLAFHEACNFKNYLQSNLKTWRTVEVKSFLEYDVEILGVGECELKICNMIAKRQIEAKLEQDSSGNWL